MNIKFPVFKTAVISVFAVVIVYSAAAGIAELRGLTREVVFSADWEQVLSACLREGEDAQSVLARMRTIGVTALIAKDQTLEDFERRGQAVRFSGPEAAKLKWLGIVDEKAPVDSRTIWVKDEQLASDIAAIVAENGLELSTRSVQGFRILSFQKDFWSMEFTVGPDPAALAEAETAGMAVIIEPEDPRGLSKAARRYLSGMEALSAGILAQSQRSNEKDIEYAGRYNRWIISPVKARAQAWMKSAEIYMTPPGRASYRSRYLPFLALDALNEDSVRFLRFSLNTDKSIEENLSSLRDVARALRNAGYETAFPSFAQQRFPDDFLLMKFSRGWKAGIMGIFVLILAAAVPLAAVKIAVLVLRRSVRITLDSLSGRGSGGWHDALLQASSPVWEVGAGLSAVLAVSLLGGMCVHALAPLGFPGGYRTGAFITGFLPVTAAVFVLYRDILVSLSRWYHSVISVKDIVFILLAVFFVKLIFDPMAVIVHSKRLLSFVWLLEDNFPALRRHWREILFAYPALLVSFWLYAGKFASDTGPDSKFFRGRIFGGDFRPFMLLGLAAPVLICWNSARPEIPFFSTCRQISVSAFAGSFLGAGFLAVLVFVRRILRAR